MPKPDKRTWTFRRSPKPRRPDAPDPARARVARLCRERGLPEPVLRFPVGRGLVLDAVWEGLDVALLVEGRDRGHDRRRANAAALASWFVVWATAEGWAGGDALDLVKRVADGA